MTTTEIPGFGPVIDEEDIKAVENALRRGELSGNYGDTIKEFEEKFASFVGCKFGVAVTSGTTALTLAVAAAGISKGDEVLVSSSTNIATALGVTQNQGMVVPVDSGPNTWNLDLDLIDSLITKNTKAIIPVHLFGNPVDMEKLNSIADKYGLMVIEDCAQSPGAEVRGRKAGSFGKMACFSFYSNKIIVTGEGGMVTTNDPELAERLRLLRNLAFTEPRFKHEELGFNYRMPGYVSAMGLSQLGRIDQILEKKKRIYTSYLNYLRDVPGLGLPVIPAWAKSAHWVFGITIKPEFEISRDQLAKYLFEEQGIQTRTFFCPMNMQPALINNMAIKDVACPVGEELWQTGIYLPSSIELEERQIQFIADSIARASEKIV